MRENTYLEGICRDIKPLFDFEERKVKSRAFKTPSLRASASTEPRRLGMGNDSYYFSGSAAGSPVAAGSEAPPVADAAGLAAAFPELFVP